MGAKYGILGTAFDNCERLNGLWYRDDYLFAASALPNTGVLRLKNRYENFVAKTT
jgi:hypothetical protein